MRQAVTVSVPNIVIPKLKWSTEKVPYIVYATDEEWLATKEVAKSLNMYLGDFVTTTILNWLDASIAFDRVAYLPKSKMKHRTFRIATEVKSIIQTAQFTDIRGRKLDLDCADVTSSAVLSYVSGMHKRGANIIDVARPTLGVNLATSVNT